MASVSKLPNGRKAIQIVCPDGKRRTVRLGKFPMGAANKFCDRIERIAAATWSGFTPDLCDQQWLATIDARLHSRMAKVGICKARQDMTLGQWLTKYLETHDVKPSTREQLERSRDNLISHFGESRQLRTITERDATEWRYWLATEGNERTKKKDKSLAENTVRRRTGRAKQFFAEAVSAGVMESNPFEKLASATGANESRMQFIPAEWIERCIAVSTGQWPTILALARYAGLRCPSELSIKWEDVNLPERWIRIRSPKTGERVCPILPDLVPHIEAAWDASEGQEWLINWPRKRNLGTELRRIIDRAGLIAWPKSFQNLRASRETELLGEYPVKDVSAWLGNSAPVAMAHYAMKRDDVFQKAVANGIETPSKKAVQNAVQQNAE